MCYKLAPLFKCGNKKTNGLMQVYHIASLIKDIALFGCPVLNLKRSHTSRRVQSYNHHIHSAICLFFRKRSIKYSSLFVLKDNLWYDDDCLLLARCEA